MIMDFIRSQELAGRAVESVCAVLREQGVQVVDRASGRILQTLPQAAEIGRAHV